MPLGWSCAHVGVIGATARDVALAYASIAGADPLDANTADQPAPAVPALDAADLAGIRIGLYRPWFDDAEPGVVATCRRAMDALQSAGAVVRDVEIADLHLVRPTHFVTVALEWVTAYAARHAAHLRQFGPDVRLVKALADSLRPSDYVHAQRLRRRICDRFAAALREVDVIATPATGMVAPVLRRDAAASGESDFSLLDRMSRFVTAANLTGHPAISVPAGYDATGLPVGLQLIARPWREDVLLLIVAAAERLVECRPPRINFNLLAGPTR
jgi:Asp-tRNA(Asn)/Glu-tRNA(Gln) amidotransferase A subunit family amidase